MSHSLAVGGEHRVDRITLSHGELLTSAGTRPQDLHLIESGWALSHRLLPDGRRQITGLYLPGDLCDPLWLKGAATQGVAAVGALKARVIPLALARAHFDEQASFARAIWAGICVASASAAEWTLALGRKSALERVAHLLCEVHARLLHRGRVVAGECEFLLQREDIADLTGLSATHVDRTLRDLQGARLIAPLKQRLRILDLERLWRTALFEPGYLGEPLDWTSELSLG